MFEKHYIGRKVSELTVGEKSEEIGNIVFTVEAADGGAAVVRYPLTEAAGATVEAPLYGVTDSDYAQRIAQAVYTALAGYQYLPYQAKDALIDPAMELGDGVTVGGIYSVIAEADEICDGLYSAGLGAESFCEQPHEFAFKPGTERTIERKIARSSASLRVDIDQVKAQVTDEDGNYTALTLKSDGLHIGNAQGTVTIDGDSITAGTISVSDLAAGTISALVAGHPIQFNGEFNYLVNGNLIGKLGGFSSGAGISGMRVGSPNGYASISFVEISVPGVPGVGTTSIKGGFSIDPAFIVDSADDLPPEEGLAEGTIAFVVL